MGKKSSTVVLHCETSDRIKIISIDNPPVNALSNAVRRGLLDAVSEAQDDPNVDALLIIGTGKGFIAGADIREFGGRREPPALQDVCLAIEDSAKLVVAAMHGPALGGGLEVALSAHYRLAMPDARMGLPEVHLGLLPGAGGTQRAPRLIGVKAAADLMLSGRHMRAHEALSAGLVDRLATGPDVQAAGLTYVKELLAAGVKPRRTRELADRLEDKAQAQCELNIVKADVEGKFPNLFSPARIVEAMQAALDRQFSEGMQLERELFKQCLESPQHSGLIHAFFAEREAGKVPEARTAQTRPVGHVGVVGGGTMGAGIAVTVLDSGLPVVMVECDVESAARGQAKVEKVYDGLIAKGRMTAEQKAAVMSRFVLGSTYADLASMDLVIEAVFED
ncbi:MAG TPA: enoyl-CoA hydratase-related protein, partial [Rhodoferax sp.]